MSETIVLENVSILGGAKKSITVRDGIIGAVDAKAPAGAKRIDCGGLLALPGLVDLHTHLREPGREDAETIETGSRSAARGGFVAVHAMANTTPVADTAGVVEQVWSRGREVGLVDVYPVGAVTTGLGGTQLSEMGAMAMSRARVRVFSDDGKCVHDPVIMRRALEYAKTFDAVIAQHAQDPRLTEGAQMHEGVVSGELGLTGWPAVAEESIIARDVLLAEHVDSRVHICHVSTAGSVDIIRWAKARGIRVTAEVMPHHLLLTDESARGYDARFKVNPPLRTQEDVDALRAGLADGTIDVVATDHAPHPDEDKDCEWGAAAFGMIGLETAVGIVQMAMVDTGLMGWSDVARVMSEAPASIGRIADLHGRPLAAGEAANITLIDPAAPWTVDPQATASRSNNSPFGGTTLPGMVAGTFLRGKPTFAGTRIAEGFGGEGVTGVVARGADHALLVLENGDVYRGQAWGARGQTLGEIVFNTGMTGYQETLTDPSYYRQIVVMTAPHIGNTGTNDEDNESRRIWVAGFVVREPARLPSNWRAKRSLDDELGNQDVVGISGIDTRKLTRVLRSAGTMRAGIFSGDALAEPEQLLERVRGAEPMAGAHLADAVSVDGEYVIEPAPGTPVIAHVVAVDLGIKAMTPELMAARGLRVTVVPSTMSGSEILAKGPDGVFFSNGPGDPAAAERSIGVLREVLDAGVPFFGICFGNQLLGRALGFGTYKLRFGHRGINQPVMDRTTGKVEVTAHNHGFAVEAPLDGPTESPAGYGKVLVSHVCLNDDVVEGLECLDIPAFSVQYHPEAAAGPHDAAYLFDRFIDLIQGRRSATVPSAPKGKP